jgi:hypothetical protein
MELAEKVRILQRALTDFADHLDRFLVVTPRSIRVGQPLTD